jgi:HTH-type transcriptional regulator/antitoxin HigA
VNIRPIRSKEDHKQALVRINEIFNAEYGTPICDELEILSALVCEYEHREFVMEQPSILSRVEFRLDQQGCGQLTQKLILWILKKLGV